MQRILLVCAIGIFFALPAIALAQFSNPLVPCDGPTCEACHAVTLVQNILTFLVAIASFIAIAIFMWAGFLMVTAAGSEGKISKAKGMFTNVFIGIIIVLAGWLIVDTVMKYLFEGSQLDGSTRTAFGPWNQIGCVEQPVYQPGKAATTTSSGSVGTTGGGRGGNGALCPPGSGCSPDELVAAGLNQRQANVASCIAMTESSGNASAYNRGTTARPSSACGLFQVVGSTWRGIPHSASCSNHQNSCRDASCNRAAAVQLIQRNGFRDWTCPNCNAKAQACVNRYQ